jgi:hypothetical protein
MQFFDRLEEARLQAAGLCRSPDDIVADSLANCVACNELQKLYPPTRLGEIREKLLQTMSFDAFAHNYDFSPLIAGDVLQLALFDTVLLVDDCSSMNEGTKWSDVKCIVENIVNMVSQINSSGLQVEFVHRDVRALGVTSSDDLDTLFELMQPSGCTPFIQPLTVKVLEPFYSRCRGHRLSLSEPVNALEVSRLRLEIEAQIEGTRSNCPADQPDSSQCPPAIAPAAATHPSPSCSSQSVGSGGSSFIQQLHEKRKSRDLQLELGAGLSPFAAASPTSLSPAATASKTGFDGQSGDESGTSNSPKSSSVPQYVKPIVVYLITDRVPTAERSQQLIAKVDASLRRIGMPRSSINFGIVHVGADSETVSLLSQSRPHVPRNPFVGCRMSYISDYEVEIAALDDQAAGMFNTDIYIVRLLLSSIDQRYAAPLEIEKPQAQDTLPAVAVTAAVTDFQNSDDDQDVADPDGTTASTRRESVNGAKSKTKKTPVTHGKDDHYTEDLLSKMCDGPPKPKLMRRNTGPKWSIMKIIEGLDSLQLAS